MISVSVAMATYNGQKHILRQLESLAAQSHIPAELVVTDDNSQDGTIEIVNHFAKTSPFPINVYRNDTRLGYIANFMRAASLCRSELIAFCDQDDYWYPCKIAASIEPFNDPEVLLAYHNADVVTGEGRRIGSLAAYSVEPSITMPLSLNPWWPTALGCTEIFRRSLLDLSYLQPKSKSPHDCSKPLAHDQWFFILASVFGKLAYLDEPLSAYVQHGGNILGLRTETFRNSLETFFRNPSDELHHYTEATKTQAMIFEIAKGRLNGVWAVRAAAAAEFFQMMACLYTKRRDLYSSTNIHDRLKAFGAVFWKQGYTATWGFGRRSFVKDACLGILIGHLLRPNII